MKKLVIIPILINLFLVFSFAHKPLFPSIMPSSFENALEIKDPSISQVLYSKISQSSPYTWFRFQAHKGDIITLSVGVPLIDRLKDLVPRAILIGPSLPTQELPFQIPVGYGSAFLTTNNPPLAFFEKFTRTNSWIYVNQQVTISTSGTYYFVAYPLNITPNNDKLWMVIGTKERFGIFEILSFCKIIKYVQEFHENN